MLLYFLTLLSSFFLSICLNMCLCILSFPFPYLCWCLALFFCSACLYFNCIKNAEYFLYRRIELFREGFGIFFLREKEVSNYGYFCFITKEQQDLGLESKTIIKILILIKGSIKADIFYALSLYI